MKKQIKLENCVIFFLMGVFTIAALSLFFAFTNRTIVGIYATLLLATHGGTTLPLFLISNHEKKERVIGITVPILVVAWAVFFLAVITLDAIGIRV